VGLALLLLHSQAVFMVQLLARLWVSQLFQGSLLAILVVWLSLTTGTQTAELSTHCENRLQMYHLYNGSFCSLFLMSHSNSYFDEHCKKTSY